MVLLDMDDLAHHFEAVAERLKAERLALNQLDAINGNHGDHMVVIFQVASQAARKIAGNDLASAMELASQQLQALQDNASAQLYAIGLLQFAAQFRQHAIGFSDLEGYIRAALADEKNTTAQDSKSGAVLKALISGLADWKSASPGEERGKKGMDMGYLFDLGVAYLQARQTASGRIEALAETAINVSPLAKTPYRAASGKLAIISLLESLKQG